MFFGVFDHHHNKTVPTSPQPNYWGIGFVLLAGAALLAAFGYSITHPAQEIFDDLHDSSADDSSGEEEEEE